ncbi:Sulfatase [Seminavis robusta]|uniref:Sulfatase n=1 Tax=Seminavis robusta TaxID=568900 RepID=A0A9N8HEN9_9STRA|nr:Sulfatase [Seminavis robusta]|eukprot:Sro525_g160130.1 Sulfatase (722) ;mRNA; r:25457-27622
MSRSRSRIMIASLLFVLVLQIELVGSVQEESHHTTESSTIFNESSEKHPNIIMIVVDQERYPPHYLPNHVNNWLKNLPGKNAFTHHGSGSTQFVSHRTSSMACSPSRATLYTGQMPSVHGVTQTYGLAKAANDDAMSWLQLNDVPTMGHYFRAAGYDTYFIGKWHMSFEDIIDQEGYIVQEPQAYRDANRLDKWGWDRWIGPEPHGTSFSNLGLKRDPNYFQQFQELLWEKEQQYIQNEKSGIPNKPWIVALNFVNPHDICVAELPLLPALVVPLYSSLLVLDHPLEEVPLPPTFDENLLDNHKPAVQHQYATRLHRMLPFPVFWKLFLRLYLFLIQTVDEHVHRVMTRLDLSAVFADNTVRVFTADHGDMNGAHGGMFQKWYQGYEEALHIPFIVRDPRRKHDATTTIAETPTQSLDVLPTLLSLAALNTTTIHKIQEKLRHTHTEVHPLPGRDLTPLMATRQEEHGGDAITAAVAPTEYDIDDTTTTAAISYFQLRDEISKGQQQVHPIVRLYPIIRFLGNWKYNAIGYDAHDSTKDVPTSIEGIVFQRASDHHVLKFMRYYDDPLAWSEPGVKDVRIDRERPAILELLFGLPPPVERTEPIPDTWEVYDLTTDPSEMINLAGDSNFASSTLGIELQRTLDKARARYHGKRNHPLPPASERNAHLPKQVKEHIESPFVHMAFVYLTVPAVYIVGAGMLWLLLITIMRVGKSVSNKVKND